MAWTELAKFKRGKVWQDGDKRALTSFAGTPIHYQNILDSNNFDTLINMAPVRVQNLQLDGWSITQNGWHYALGIDHLNHPNEDGWIGFGGRKGQHWFKFRLERMLYVHWPTRTWQTIGNLVNYNRLNLTSQTTQRTIAFGETINIANIVKWRNLWTTAGGGEVQAEWRVSSGRFKEYIYINQAGRTWITNNAPPSTPLNETYFGFAFRLDYSDIPKRYLGEVLSSLDDDIENTDIIKFTTVNDEALFFMPIDDLWVENSNGLEIDGSRLQLKKRFYKDGNNYYLIVGQRVDLINNLPNGTLVFDPTLDEDISNEVYDAHERQDGTGFTHTFGQVNCISHNVTTNAFIGGFLFEMTGGPSQGQEITSCYMTVFPESTSLDDADVEIHFEDVDDAVNFSTNADVLDRVRTTAFATWDANNLGTGANNTPSLVDACQEVVNRGSYTAGNNIVVLMRGITAFDGGNLAVENYNAGAGEGASLHVEWISESQIMSSYVLSYSSLLQVRRDNIIVLSNLLNARRDNIVNHSYRSLLNIDKIIIDEFSLSLQKSTEISLEGKLDVIHNDIYALTYKNDVVQDFIKNLSYRLYIDPANILNTSWLSHAYFNNEVDLSWLNNLNREDLLNLSWLHDLDKNDILNLSYLGNLSPDNVLNLSWFAHINFDQILIYDFLLALYGNSLLNTSHNLDVLHNSELVNSYLEDLSRENIIQVSWLGLELILADNILNLGWRGIPLITADHTISYRGNLVGDSTLNLDHNLLVDLNRVVILSYLNDVKPDNILNVSWLYDGEGSEIFKDAVFNIEFRQELIKDNLINFSNRLNLNSDNILNFGSQLDIVPSLSLPFSTLIDINGNPIFSIEYILNLYFDHITDLEFKSSFLSNYALLIECLLNLYPDQEFVYSIVNNLYYYGAIPISWQGVEIDIELVDDFWVLDSRNRVWILDVKNKRWVLSDRTKNWSLDLKNKVWTLDNKPKFWTLSSRSS